MNKESIKAVLEQAVGDLFANQPNIFEFTSSTGQTEWNLAHHLAWEIHKFFPGFDCDLDVIKSNLGNRRPDIILHRRGTHAQNFLVIEMKRNGAPEEREKDLERIKRYWFGEELRYQFGAAINLRENKSYEVEVLENERR